MGVGKLSKDNKVESNSVGAAGCVKGAKPLPELFNISDKLLFPQLRGHFVHTLDEELPPRTYLKMDRRHLPMPNGSRPEEEGYPSRPVENLS